MTAGDEDVTPTDDGVMPTDDRDPRSPTPGLHHVSAGAGDPQGNLDFYTDVLGLKLVKRTVNFDDRFSYHLYYGDDSGTPGTLLTCFPSQGGTDGRVGHPQSSAVALAVPEGAAAYWHDRLADGSVDVDEPAGRFDETVVRFRDPDGLPVELVERDTDLPPATGAVPEAYAVRGLDGVTLLSTSIYHTASTLEVLGFELLAQDGRRVRYRAPGAHANVVDLLDVEVEYGREGAGTIHHVAFVAGDEPLEGWRDRLQHAGLEPTWIRDRNYFRSIYVREPGGIQFEIATTEPGMTVDESPDALGSALQLPPEYEQDRDTITSQLPPLSD